MAKKRLLKDTQNTIKGRKGLLKVPEKSVKGTRSQLKVYEKTVKSKKIQLIDPQHTVKGTKKLLKVTEKTVKGKQRQLKDTQNRVNVTKRLLYKVPEKTVKGKKRQLKDSQNTVQGATKRQLKVPVKTVKGKKIQLKDSQNTVKETKRQLNVPENPVKSKKRQLKYPAKILKDKKRQVKDPEETEKRKKRHIKDPEMPPIKKLKKGHNDNLSKAATKSFNIERFYSDFITDVRQIQKNVETLLTITVKQANRKKSKTEILKKMESVTMACNILVEQINKISSNLFEMQDNNDNEMLFNSIEQAEIQLKHFEDRLNQLDMNKTMQQYKNEATNKLNAKLDELKASGKNSFSDSTSSSSASMLKTPIFIKEIDHKSSIRGSIILPNQKLLITDQFNKVKLIDTKRETIVSELMLPYLLWDITEIKADEFAIACPNNEVIQFVSLTSDKLSLGREMPFSGGCYGMEYNDHQNKLIVTNMTEHGIEILSLTGRVIKRLGNDSTGNRLLQSPHYVALSPDKKMLYVSDCLGHSVTLMTLNGEVKTVYKDKSLLFPKGICINRSGIVYVVGYNSSTVHQIVPGSDKLEPILDRTNGLFNPITISYCDVEDKLYVGQDGFNGLKIFKMRK